MTASEETAAATGTVTATVMEARTTAMMARMTATTARTTT